MKGAHIVTPTQEELQKALEAAMDDNPYLVHVDHQYYFKRGFQEAIRFICGNSPFVDCFCGGHLPWVC